MMRNTLWGCLALVALIPLSSPLVGRVDGWLFPVAGPVAIEQINSYEDGWTYFSMSGPKHRECRWRSTKFFLGGRSGNNVPVPFEHLDKPEVRKIGDQYWPSSRIQLSPEQLLNSSHADVYHDCGWWLWLTRTPLYN